MKKKYLNSGLLLGFFMKKKLEQHYIKDEVLSQI